MRFSKMVVAYCIAVTTLYAASVVLLAFGMQAFPPAELTAAIFAMYGFELGASAWIKVKESGGEATAGRHAKENEDGQ